MRYAGIDIGSRSIELVVLENDQVVLRRQSESGYNPVERVQTLLADVSFDNVMATGYGRGSLELAFDFPTVTEIKAYGIGAASLNSDVRTILDIGAKIPRLSL